MLGQVVYHQSAVLQNGLNRITLELQDLPKGIYTLSNPVAPFKGAQKLIVE
jgi:hypothetical protein